MSYAERFKGRAAVITGGAAGIGFAVAERIVEEGGRVAIWDFNSAHLEEAKGKFGDKAAFFTVDVVDWASVEKAAAASAEALGGVDILVASAGITGPNATLRDYPVEDWKRVIDINLNGVFNCNKAVVPYMQQKDYGRIVNIASIAGKEGNPNASAYSASKAGVIGLTKSLGKELAASGITVNCVTPAAVRTGMFAQMTQQHIDYMLSKIPKGRFCGIEEVTALICWLASEECSFSTGAVFDVSGGRATY